MPVKVVADLFTPGHGEYDIGALLCGTVATGSTLDHGRGRPVTVGDRLCTALPHDG